VFGLARLMVSMMSMVSAMVSMVSTMVSAMVSMVSAMMSMMSVMMSMVSVTVKDMVKQLAIMPERFRHPLTPSVESKWNRLLSD
jgi:phage-related protein